MQSISLFLNKQETQDILFLLNNDWICWLRKENKKASKLTWWPFQIIPIEVLIEMLQSYQKHM